MQSWYNAVSEVAQPGVDLIQQFEGCHLEAYPDPLTQGEPYTIGWGSTRRQDGTPFLPGDTLTQAEADELLHWQLEHDFLPALRTIPRWSTLNPQQAGALLSFAYNLGAGFYGSGDFQTITRVLDEADWDRLEYAFTLYRNPGSPVEEGLLRRRLTEAQIFLAGTPGVDLSEAGQLYLSRTDHTYTQQDFLSDQALQYLAAIAPASPTVATPPSSSPRLLYRTDPPLTGEDVRQVQEALVRAGAPLTVDGVFGEATQQAVEWFQRFNGLAVDGVVNEPTRSRLMQRSLALTDPYMTGDDVKALQQALQLQGVELTVDGVFGPTTQAAVETFQRQTGLLVDGIAGSHTRRILNARTLYLTQPQMRGEDVKWVQKTLTRNGLPVTIDGIFGPETAWTIKQFQTRHYLYADGIVGPKTWVKLGL